MAWLKNNKILILIIFIFLLFNNLPHLVGSSQSIVDSNVEYNGAPLVNQGDYFVYLSYIEQGKNNVFVKNLYDYQAESSPLFSPLWFGVGQVAILVGNIVSYHIFRIIFTGLFIAVVWWWLKQIFDNYKQRLFTLMMLLFSGGLGIFFLSLWPNADISPVDLWVSESNTFLSLNQGPLFSLSQILILSVLGLFIKGYKTKNTKLIFSSSILNLFLIIIHPYELVIVNILLSLWAIFKYIATKDKIVFKYIGAIYISSILAGLYYLWLLQDPSMAKYNANNIVASRNILEYIFGFGGLLVLSTLGIYYSFKNKLLDNDYLKMIIIWSVAGWIMVYLPLDFNRRLSNGWHMPMTILSSLALFYFYKKIPNLLRYGFIAVLVIILSFDTLYQIALNTNDVYSGQNKNSFYINKARKITYEIINKNTTNESIILTRGIDGNWLPAFVSAKVYMGHIAQTWQTELKNKEVYDLWTSHQDISGWLKAKNIDFIFASSQHIPEFDDIKWLAKENYIRPIINNNEFIFYQVRDQQ